MKTVNLCPLLFLICVATNSFSQTVFPLPAIGIGNLKSIVQQEENREAIVFKKTITSFDTKGSPQQTLIITDNDTIQVVYKDSILGADNLILRRTKVFTKNVNLYDEYYAIRERSDSIFYRKIIAADTVLYRDYFFDNLGALKKIETRDGSKRCLSTINITYKMKDAGRRAEIFHKMTLSDNGDSLLNEILVKEFDHCNRLFKIKYFDKDSTIFRLDIFFRRTGGDFYELPHTAISCLTENLQEAEKKVNKTALIDELEKSWTSYNIRTRYQFDYYKREKAPLNSKNKTQKLRLK
jgi:hypothetical protein